MRLKQPRPWPRRQLAPGASGRKNSSVDRIHDGFSHENPLQTPKTKRPRDSDPRAFALPREIGVTDLRERNRSISKNFGQMPFAAHAWQHIASMARRQTEMCEVIQHDKPSNKLADMGEGREHYVSFIFNASAF
ncbi:hypothetical protein [Dyella flagellata]|uniref:hypothetical protein n=1 Tax=Dyella flagellata TaxID=1867833 RepID=UPI0024E128DA|nr:hypothetical protein [Dyella flagellata]